jgi:uncharacterized protein (TIGR03067 family)
MRNWFWALGVLVVLTPVSTADPGQNCLTPDTLHVLLNDMGYEPRSLDQAVEVTIDRDRWPVHISLSVSDDGEFLWLAAKFSPITEADSLPSDALLRLLEVNDRIGPAHFAYRPEDRRIHLYRPVANQDLTAPALRQRIDEFDTLVRETEEVWRSTNFRSVSTPVTPAPEVELGDLAKLQGTWQVIGIETQGQNAALTDVVASSMTFTFRGDTLVIQRTASAEEVTQFKINPDASPAQMNITNAEGQVEQAIYRLDGNRLLICFAEPGHERPVDFITDENFAGGLLVLERAPEVEAD